MPYYTYDFTFVIGTINCFILCSKGYIIRNWKTSTPWVQTQWKYQKYGGSSALNCDFCSDGEETSAHIFLHCKVVMKVWEKVFQWLNFNFLIPNNLFVHFECWSVEVQSKKLRKGYQSIWHAFMWVIWKMRNDRIFNDRNKGVDDKLTMT
jgi:hypothetical protein